jgi:hypothetical protein
LLSWSSTAGNGVALTVPASSSRAGGLHIERATDHDDNAITAR